MIVAMFHGIKKPPELEQYLRPFVEEMNEVLDNGIPINNRVVRVRLRAFISDSPARSYIKGVMSYNAKHGCLKCCTVGEHSYQSRTVYFWDSNAPERTDELFRRIAYPKHYRIYTPLLDFQYLNIIEDIVVADRLHLIDLGVMRRLLKAWVKGVFGTQWKLAPEQCSRISKTLEKMQIPSEIHRYASLVVLRDHLSKSAYNHFLLLFCAFMRNIGHMPTIISYMDIISYHISYMYGIDYVASNIHNLLHVYNDVRKFGPLYSISFYPFENEMQHIKQLQRSGYKSLEQVAKRLFEFENAHIMRLRTERNSEPYLQQTKTGVKVIFTDFMLRKVIVVDGFLP
uniref:Uncharacterized protein n=1 Tax=Anopheles funestus TaxID=62324 RepID=A0A4Y0BIJ4_ANOFN